MMENTKRAAGSNSKPCVDTGLMCFFKRYVSLYTNMSLYSIRKYMKLAKCDQLSYRYKYTYRFVHLDGLTIFKLVESELYTQKEHDLNWPG